jgi:TorA maturation chaperone TorD
MTFVNPALEHDDNALTPEDASRADHYAACARLLLAPPDEALHAALAQVEADPDTPLSAAWSALAASARALPPADIDDEFARLFVSTGTPAIDPYASKYLTGFMHEKPLADLRDELSRLGLARSGGRAESEDHLALLCEVMRVLIAGEPAAMRAGLDHQRQFFHAHLAPWAGKCLADIRIASDGGFYARVADLAACFFDVEREAFRYGAVIPIERQECTA